ncbi:hypothetical protein GGS21DRAFT_352179 [Xylaria nigripes]|nr:hypothetical protein GGS21DRAFT_352179 [Xylaria nigripes]
MSSMADKIPPQDLTLLERLNALRPSSINLTSTLPSSKSDPASTIERAKPPSREDALTARLKSLRDQGPDSSVSNVINQEPGDKGSILPRPTGSAGSFTENGVGIQQSWESTPVVNDVDPLHCTDDETLEELLEDLRSDEAWLDEMVAEEEHKRVTALLADIRKSSSVDADLDSHNTHQGVSQEDGEDSSADDSEGEIMVKEVNSMLAKTIDEIEWEKDNQPPSPSTQFVPTPPSPPQNANQSSDRSQGEDSFDLPTVPSDFQDQTGMSASSAQTQADADFAASIASRMAALKFSGNRALPSTPNMAIDSLELPQAPTFVPADRPLTSGTQRTRYTDEDQKTWCVVCLEDGTVHCLDCEPGDDMYCARCWKAMHVGPQAGYDERGHSWETSVSRPR